MQKITKSFPTPMQVPWLILTALIMQTYTLLHTPAEVNLTTGLIAVGKVLDFIADAFNGIIVVNGTCICDAMYNATLEPAAFGLNLEPLLSSLLAAHSNATKNDPSSQNQTTSVKRDSNRINLIFDSFFNF